MNAEVFAEWLTRQGHKIYRTSSSYWYDAGPRVLQAFPYHWLISPGKKELRDLILQNGIAALRYSSPPDSDYGKISYHIVQNKCYSFDNLNNKARNGVKRGLACFEIENISFERLAKEGWYLQQDTLLRQNRSGSMNRKEWERLCLSALDLPGFEVIAALSGGELASAVIICRIDDICCTPYAMSHSRFLKTHVNNALFYSLSCDYLNRENISGIFFTVQSLDAPANVDEFKIRMGFKAKPVRQTVVVHPVIRPFFNRSLHYLTNELFKRYPSSNSLAKTEGMMRFYLEGKNPVGKQSLPGCLKEEMKLTSQINKNEKS